MKSQDIIKHISTFMREHYRALEPAELKEEATRLRNNQRKQAAGRICEQTLKEREEGFKNIEKYYEEKRLWDRIVGPHRFYAKPR